MRATDLARPGRPCAAPLSLAPSAGRVEPASWISLPNNIMRPSGRCGQMKAPRNRRESKGGAAHAATRARLGGPLRRPHRAPSAPPSSGDGGGANAARDGGAKRRRVVRNGRPSNDLVLSASTDGNDIVFPDILRLYVRPGCTVADVTYGKGVFWKNVPRGLYDVRATDISTGTDCRSLPYGDGEVDCVVLDPPYMHSPGGTAHATHAAFERHYRNNGSGNQTGSKYHQAVIDLYDEAGVEACRVLRDNGVLIVKCQDEVCANRQQFTHVELMKIYEKMGLVAEDMFVVVRQNRPGVSRMVRQVHARKNHSYFLVFWKRGAAGGLWRPEA